MIGLIAAMNSEIDAVTDRMSDVSTETIGNVEFRKGSLQDEEIVIALSGVGKVHAAIAATLMCQVFKPDALMSIGVAGGLQDDQQLGDLVISDHAIQADFDTSFIDGDAGIGLRFDADPVLVEHARKVAEKSDRKWRIGTVATQDLFLAAKADYEKLMARFPEAACNEMEGAAVAEVADTFKIPFVILRTLSDVVTHDDNPVEFETFALHAAKQAAGFLEEFCRH